MCIKRIAVVSFFVVIGCRPPIAPDRNEYELVSVNGSSLPIVAVPSASNSAWIVEGNLHLDEDTFSFTIVSGASAVLRDGRNIDVLSYKTDHGSFSRVGDAVEFIAGDGRRYSGQFSHDELTLVREIIADSDNEPDMLFFRLVR